MRTKILSILLVICMIMSQMAFVVSADEVVVTRYAGIVDGTMGSVFAFTNTNTQPTAVAAGLGGKAADDAYLAIDTNAFVAGDMRLYFNNGADRFTNTYYVLNMNIYGNNTFVGGYNRYQDSSNKVTKTYLPTVDAVALRADEWNNVKWVYTVASHTMDVYVNDVKYNTKSADFSVSGTSHLNRVCLNFATSVGTICVDDLAIFSTNALPLGYLPAISGDDITVFDSTNNIMFSGESVTLSTDDTVRVSGDDGATWTETKVVNAGDTVVVENETAYGKAYTTYQAFSSTGFKNVLATSTSGVSYIQGGSPKDSEGNALSSTKTNVENVFGSGLTMELMASGVNNSTSTQTYYQYTWPNATNTEATAPNYLVLEADVATPVVSGNLDRASTMGLSSNGGTGIGTRIEMKTLENSNRINHYMWIYDKSTGTYMDYLNGKPMQENPVAIHADFVSGKKNALRFGANGTYKENAANPAQLYGGYLANLEIYECYEYEVRTPLYIPGAEFSTLPVVGRSTTLGQILALFDEADRDKVTVFANRSYNPITDEDATVTTGSAVIMTQKDGLYDYARVCMAPSEDADYALETIQVPSDGSVYVVLLNYGEERTFTPILVRYDNESGAVLDVEFRNPTLVHGGQSGFGLPATDAKSSVEFLLWDGFSALKPLGDAMKLK